MQLAVVDGIDITRFIDKETYKVNSSDVYESWQNGNFIEKRIQIRTRVEGSFTIRCGKGFTLERFLEYWNAAVEDKIVTIGLFVQNHNDFEAIQAFYTFEGQQHVELDNGGFYDELNISIQEC